MESHHHHQHHKCRRKRASHKTCAMHTMRQRLLHTSSLPSVCHTSPPISHPFRAPALQVVAQRRNENGSRQCIHQRGCLRKPGAGGFALPFRHRQYRPHLSFLVSPLGHTKHRQGFLQRGVVSYHVQRFAIALLVAKRSAFLFENY